LVLVQDQGSWEDITAAIAASEGKALSPKIEIELKNIFQGRLNRATV
jgi:hypothetical protein